jgi:pyruvate/2-oxoglutarate dehydrogenase complex dihydrolipoamide dehydrogenase (E3) component
MPYSGGLNRNIVQCLNDFNIPLKLSHTIAQIHGKDRVEGVTIAKVDERLRVIPEESEYVECDTILLSCGLIPENELTKGAGIALDNVTKGAVVNQDRETEKEGIYACGNVLHVHDLVDYVSEESAIAGNAAAKYVQNGCKDKETIKKIYVEKQGAVRYTVPQRIDVCENQEDVKVYFRVGAVMKDVNLVVRNGDKELMRIKKRKVAPGEMETVKIKGSMLNDSDRISISVE